MKTIKKLYKLAATGALLTAFALNFNACTENTSQIAGPVDNATVNPSLAKEATATAIVAVDTITAALGGQLKVHSKDINDGEFNVRPGNVTSDLVMHLVKLSKTSNSYHFESLGLDMPAGVRITLEYSHSAMPFGVSESDLKVFKLVGDHYVALDSKASF